MSSADTPLHLNVEQQRKRAKDLRRDHASGSLPAAVRIARYLPRVRGQSPDRILAAPFTLSEAQFVTAREAGFSSWPQLKHTLEPPAGAPDHTAPPVDDALAARDEA